MPQYRKKPVVIDAIQLPTAELQGVEREQRVWDVIAFFGQSKDWRINEDGNGGVLIHTLEGEMEGSPGDWIIKGVRGEFYPCKPDIFAATYEPVAPEPFTGDMAPGLLDAQREPAAEIEGDCA